MTRRAFIIIGFTLEPALSFRSRCARCACLLVRSPPVGTFLRVPLLHPALGLRTVHSPSVGPLFSVVSLPLESGVQVRLREPLDALRILATMGFGAIDPCVSCVSLVNRAWLHLPYL